MRRVDCYSENKVLLHSIFCKTKEDSLVIKHNTEVENGYGKTVKIFKLKKYDKALLHCTIYLYKKDNLVAKVYAATPSTCFILKTLWLLVKDRKIKFKYKEEQHGLTTTQEFERVSQGIFMPLGEINKKLSDAWLKNKAKNKK
jgi:hypothetical protein